ncbi:7-cyano-7-deazaguanine synthase QueC [Methylophaga sp.]|jgi:7-cyano-7-deazaguanine synthase|uniref:7-cyano-7-deazaguanine synthase QueC n=1 Tax=Methylophaga sp. TaxID=2024840 RepID=UPI001400C080|nr:7-cyano-7-deazaguanine synthase QueC [Methylophaga sp.]MTI62752.1 7-cyano-7-deazaguanine synthase QueC [Methylophaga sp.]
MKRAVVLLSGGLDSATVLAIARSQGYDCHTISFDYGQRHRAELNASALLSEQLGAVSHKLIHIDLTAIGGSALTDTSIAVPHEHQEGIPVTYVPARNTVFMSIALGWAEVLQAEAIFVGVNAVDYSGYPDCRPEYIAAFEKMANLATKSGVEGHPLKIATPLIDLSKQAIIRRGIELGVDYSLTVSCYEADETGRACGECDSCRFRRQGFEQAGIKDPTRYQP